VGNVGYGMRPHAFHLAAIETRRVDVLLTFGDYNLLRQTAGETLLPAAEAQDIGVLNGWAIMRGMLTGRPVEEVAARDRWLAPADVERAAAMRAWCADQHVSLLNLALQFCLRDPRMHGHPLGSLNVEQLETNVAAVTQTVPEEVFAQFVAAFLTPHEPRA